MRSRSRRESVINGVGVDEVGLLLSDDQEVATWAEGDLRRLSRGASAQRTSGTSQQRQLTRLTDHEAGDIRCSTRIEHVQEISMECQANRRLSTRTDLVCQRETVFPHAKHGDLIASGIHGEQQMVVFAKDKRVLGRERI